MHQRQQMMLSISWLCWDYTASSISQYQIVALWSNRNRSRPEDRIMSSADRTVGFIQYNLGKMRIRSEHELREWNLDTIHESRTWSEDSVSTVRPDAQYITTWYELQTIQYNRPTYGNPAQYNTTRYEPRAIGLQYIHVRQTPNSTYDPQFVLYFLREYSMARCDT
jgi:hypothetical protein